MRVSVFVIILVFGVLLLFTIDCVLDFLLFSKTRDFFYNNSFWSFLDFEVRRQAFVMSL